METQIKSILTVLVLVALSAKAMSSIVPTQERVVPHQFSCTNPSIHSKVPTVSLYYALVDAADWDEASVKCNETYSGSRLASIETLAELNCLAQNLDPFAPVTYWTAGRFVDSMGWIWDVDHIPYPFPQDTTWLWTADQPAFETALSRANFHVTNTWDAKLSSVVKSEEYLPLCELSEPIPVPCRNPNDLVLVVDSSGSIGADNFNLALTFVARLSNAFTPHVDTRFSYVVYSTGAETPIKLNNSLTPEQIDSIVLNTVYQSGGTDTALGITIATTELVINPRNAPQAFVVLTDGQSNDPAATIAAAQQAVNRGIRTYAVGIGAGVNAAELLAIAGGIPENVYSLETFDQLINVLVPISLKVCPMS